MNHIFSPVTDYFYLGFYPKPEYRLFQLLVRSHGPDAKCLVPEYNAYDGSEREDEEVFAAETLHEQRQIRYVYGGGENCVEEVSWKQQLAQFHVVPEHADFDFANQEVVSADVLFPN